MILRKYQEVRGRKEETDERKKNCDKTKHENHDDTMTMWPDGSARRQHAGNKFLLVSKSEKLQKIKTI